MPGWRAGSRPGRHIDAQSGKIKLVDEDVEATEQKRRLSPILALDETAYAKPSDTAMSEV